MHTFRDVIARMAVDVEFARHARAHPDEVGRTFGLTAEEVQKLRGLADAQADAGPTALGARLSKSGIGSGAFASAVAGTPVQLDPPSPTGEGLQDALNDPSQFVAGLEEEESAEKPATFTGSLATVEHITNPTHDGDNLTLPPGSIEQIKPDNDGVLEALHPHNPPGGDQPGPEQPPTDQPAEPSTSEAQPADPPDPAAPADPVSPPYVVVLPDPFADEHAHASDDTASHDSDESNEQAVDAVQSATAGPSVAVPAAVTPPGDDIGAEELAIGAAGFAAGAVAGGVAGAVAGKAIVAGQQDEKKG